MAATTIQRALTCSPRAVAMIASAIAPRMPTRTQGPCVRRVVVMACSVPAGFCFPADYAPARQDWKVRGLYVCCRRSGRNSRGSGALAHGGIQNDSVYAGGVGAAVQQPEV